MNHVRFDAKYGQDNKGEVVISRDHHGLSRRARMLIRNAIQCATGVDRLIIYGRHPNPSACSRTDGHVKVPFVGSGDRFSAQVAQEEPDHDAFRFVFDRGDTGVVNFRVCGAVLPKQ